MTNKLLHLTLSTHNFTITRLNGTARNIVYGFIKRNIQYGLTRLPGGRFTSAPVKVFGASNANRNEFRLHINQYTDFKKYLKEAYVTDNLFTEETLPVPDTEIIDIKVRPQWKLRDTQLNAFDYLIAKTNYRSRFVDMATGSGKTVTSLIAMATFNKKIAFVLKPMYIEKWVADLKKTYVLCDNDIMVVTGSSALQGLIEMGINKEIKSKFIIISNKTIQNWYTLYEKYGEETITLGYSCFPEDLFETIGCGVRLIDEVHQDFHLNFKVDLYSNIERSISLSATLLNNDPFIEKMYCLAYPKDQRYNGGIQTKYIIAKALMYGLKNSDLVRTTEFNSPNYSHNAYEKSIMRNRSTRENYLRLIWNSIETSYIANYKPGQRCAVFCSSVDTCTIVSQYLSRMYPNKDVRRYVSEDPYENLLEPDITVTTILSGGTAHDIANLTTVILTINVDSIQASIQTMGRLRKLSDASTYFIYFVCRNIPKHMKYHQSKQAMLADRAANFVEINAPFMV
jgi:superfamily II DNA or RNA helicase